MTTTTTTTTGGQFAPDYIVPPGDTILDLLDEREMTQTDLARRLGVSAKHVNQIVKGSAPISSDVALGLEKVLGGSVSFWATREALYQARMAAQAENEELESQIGWAQQFPIRELKDRNLIPKEANGAQLVAHLLRFLGIAHPRHWADPSVAYRKTRAFESDSYALSAWLRLGEIEASRIECDAYDHDRFLDALDEIRRLTRDDPEQWEPEMKRLCAAAGVAVVIVKHFSKARANGATRWISPSKAVIQLSLRYKWEDIFWFTFFHEAGHVVLHKKKQVFVEPLKPKEGLESAAPAAVRLEHEADRFAARTLIPLRYERRLRHLNPADIPRFADQLGVAPAIVVGRMQHEGVLPYSQGHEFRRRFEFGDDE
jgi:HTH-type transcriptional regulator/antitoxin HigA